MVIGTVLPLTLAAAAQPQPAPAQRPIGQPRRLFVFAPDRNDPMLQRQQALLRGGASAVHERDLHVIEVIGDTVAGAHDYAAALRQRYAVQSARFGIVLVGRDGGVKLRSRDVLSLDRLTGTIDAMPMRRREMANR
jgi:hypothetical protein